jgi:hypothetical protein
VQHVGHECDVDLYSNERIVECHGIPYLTHSRKTLFSPWGLHFIHILFSFHVFDHWSFCYEVQHICGLENMIVGLNCENVTFCLLSEP